MKTHLEYYNSLSVQGKKDIRVWLLIKIQHDFPKLNQTDIVPFLKALYEELVTAIPASLHTPIATELPCICEENNPCDYHAATCVVCEGKCKGHPSHLGY